MWRVVTRRVLQAALAMLAVLLVVFVCLLATGDPVEMLVPPEATDADKARIRQAYGLDRPVLYQFAAFVSRAALGDFGRSFFSDRPALALVLERLPASLELAVLSTVIAVLIGVPLGVLAAVRRGTLVDQLVIGVALLGQSIASFWLALILILGFAVTLHWLPVSGRTGWASLVLPSVALSVWLLALLARLTRSEMLGVLDQDYIRTARAKGMGAGAIHFRHALRNALIPLVTVTGVSLGWQLGGAVVIETVFAWPGLGTVLLEAVLRRDYPVVLAGVAVLSVAFVGINLVVDLLYTRIDPRVRLGAS
jgi:ABC-type dipeptide/oligopeptide/nickel transport system permease component